MLVECLQNHGALLWVLADILCLPGAGVYPAQAYLRAE